MKIEMTVNEFANAIERIRTGYNDAQLDKKGTFAEDDFQTKEELKRAYATLNAEEYSPSDYRITLEKIAGFAPEGGWTPEQLCREALQKRETLNRLTLLVGKHNKFCNQLATMLKVEPVFNQDDSPRDDLLNAVQTLQYEFTEARSALEIVAGEFDQLVPPTNTQLCEAVVHEYGLLREFEEKLNTLNKPPDDDIPF